MYRLGRGDHLYTISEMSGLGISTVSSICQEVCQVLVNHLWNETVSTHMPQTGEEFKQKILNIEEFWQFPCCWTAIDMLFLLSLVFDHLVSIVEWFFRFEPPLGMPSLEQDSYV